MAKMINATFAYQNKGVVNNQANVAFTMFAIIFTPQYIYTCICDIFLQGENLCKSIFRPVRPSSSSNLTYGRIIQFIVNIIIIIISAIFSAGLGFLLLVDILEKRVYSEKSSEWLFVQSSHLFSVINVVTFFSNSALQKQLCHYVTALASCLSSRLVEHLHQ